MRKNNAMAVMAGLLLALVGTGLGNLLVNGDFEQPLEVGWQEDVQSLAGGYLIERSDTLGQPMPGHAARVYKLLAYHASLSQVVDVPGPELTLTFDSRMQLAGGSSTCWPTAALVVSYLNADARELGSTMFLLRDPYNDWRESDTLKFHDVQLPDEWVGYELDIAREIADNLPGVSAEEVRKVGVRLFSYVNGT
ncbi:MAG: hypothetical protein R6X14_07900 [bacterium]